VLVDALAQLRARGIVVPVVVAGDAFPGGEVWADRLREHLRSTGTDEQVQLLGYVDDVPSLLDRSSIFVLPSTRPEPFGLALLEAMGRGLPCIATDAGGPRDMVRDGETGLLVPMGDPTALASAIERLWRCPDLRSRLGRAAADDVRARFRPSQTVSRVDALYRVLISGDSPSDLASMPAP
jgi:L-malate glycosyltransferase